MGGPINGKQTRESGDKTRKRSQSLETESKQPRRTNTLRPVSSAMNAKSNPEEKAKSNPEKKQLICFVIFKQSLILI